MTRWSLPAEAAESHPRCSVSVHVTRRWTVFTSLSLVSVLLFSGCASPMEVVRDPGRLIGRPRTANQVGRIITLWEAAEGSNVEGKPCRGFAGQIMFFGPAGDTPMKVEGPVTIYEYDQFDPDQEDPRPHHSFSFEPDAWNVHGRDGTLGHTYSVFIPYMQPHKEQVMCGLSVEFHCEDGRKLSSDITPVLLPGKSSDVLAGQFRRAPIQRQQIGGSADQTIHQASDATPRRLETVTIPLPRR